MASVIKHKSYVDRFLTYAPLTDTLDVCGGDTAPSYVRVENKHFPPRTKGRFRVYVPEDQLEQLKEKLEEYDNQHLATNCSIVTPDSWEKIIEDATALGAEMGRRTTQVGDLVERCKRLLKEGNVVTHERIHR